MLLSVWDCAACSDHNCVLAYKCVNSGLDIQGTQLVVTELDVQLLGFACMVMSQVAIDLWPDSCSSSC